MTVNKFSLDNIATPQLERQRSLKADPAFKGLWSIELWRDGKCIHKEDAPNGVTNVGKNSILGVQFHADTQITAWYLGLIDASGYSALAAGDTMSSHAGWTELTGYSQATRPQWSPDAAASQAITNSTLVQFDINATGTLKGGFLVSNSTKGGTTGTLWGTALFSGDIPVSNGDILKVTYTVSAS